MNPITEIIQFPILHLVANFMIAIGSIYIVYANYTMSKYSNFKELYKRFLWSWLSVALIHAYEPFSMLTGVHNFETSLKLIAGIVIINTALSFHKNLVVMKKQPTTHDKEEDEKKIRQQEDEIYSLKQQLINHQLATEDLFRTRLKKKGISEELLKDLQSANEKTRRNWDDSI